jgi:hypothetical protein
MFVNAVFSNLWRIFNANNLEYMGVGRYPPVQHFEPRFPKNLDTWIGTELNVISVDQSVKEFNAQLAVT